MPNALVLENKQYSIYVKVLAGQGDGTLIYIDARGHIHVVGPGDPPFSKEKLTAAATQINSGVVAALHAIGAQVAKA
jgi:hypothetical protein